MLFLVFDDLFFDDQIGGGYFGNVLCLTTSGRCPYNCCLCACLRLFFGFNRRMSGRCSRGCCLDRLLRGNRCSFRLLDSGHLTLWQLRTIQQDLAFRNRLFIPIMSLFLYLYKKIYHRFKYLDNLVCVCSPWFADLFGAIGVHQI